MTTEKTINAFISSTNRNSSEEVYDFTVKFVDYAISCTEDQYIKINVISFDMLNTMYNVSSKNNSFYLERPEKITYTIPDGNYTVHTLKAVLNDLLSGCITVSYNVAQNTYNFKNIWNSDITLHGDTASSLLGITDKLVQLSNSVNGTYVNMVNYNKVILRATNINYDVACIENISSSTSKLTFGDILFWKSKQDVEPFRNICYTNEDSGNSFNVLIHDKTISNIRLKLMNEYGQLITDAPDYLLVLQFVIYNKDNWIKENILDITQSLKQIWVSILWICENFLKII
jgi:hypothetical protein